MTENIDYLVVGDSRIFTLHVGPREYVINLERILGLRYAPGNLDIEEPPVDYITIYLSGAEMNIFAIGSSLKATYHELKIQWEAQH